MPSAVFPRPSSVYVATCTGITIPTGRRQLTWSGKIQTRSSMNVGRMWAETYQPIFAGSVDGENFISWLRWAWNTQTVFTVDHPMTPGSGLSPNGTGSAGVTVSGASQTGSSLVTTGWPTSTSNVARAGDLIKAAGLGYTLEVTDDVNSDGSGNATLNVSPPMWASPTNAGAVTTTNVSMSAVIMELRIPEISNAFYYDGVQVSFRESP